MRFIFKTDFTGEKPWDALDIAAMQDATVRLHWTDAPYIWHTNDGEEVFAVMDGVVDMHYREGDQTHIQTMQAGDICFAETGDEHVAHPQGAARVLVIEKRGSI